MRIPLFFSSPRAFIFPSRLLFLIFFAASLLATNASLLCAQTPEEAVRGLSRRVLEIHELPEKVALEWSNVSSLPEPESIILREAFVKELSSHRQIVAADSSVTLLRGAVRETPTDFLLVARVPTASGEQVRMAGVARTAFLPVMTRGNGLRLAKQLLWQQAETILDAGEFAEFPGNTVPAGVVPAGVVNAGVVNAAANRVTDIFILKPDALVIYRDEGERLSEIQQLPFSGYKYVSRGLRGEIRRGKDGNIVVALPGLNCTVHGPATTGERWAMQCGAPTTSDTTTAPAAAPVASVTTVSSNCDAISWRLLAEASDWTQPDRMLLVNAEMKREEAVAALDFAGPVRRLAGAEGGKSALAVVFNLSSGSYEVYRIAVVCGR